jgi:hypothetical protein
MTITNYTTLKAAIADWLLRDDLTAVIPSFIALAETQMQREIRHHKMMQRLTIPIAARYSALPADWLETARIQLLGDRPVRLELTSMDDMLQLRQMNADTSGRPTHYAHVGEELEVFPTPGAPFNAEILYFQKIPPLSDGNATNWLLTDYPDVYLYGALMQAAPYLDDDAKMQVWAGLYGSSINSINAESKKARYSGAGMRMRINSY